MAGMGKYRVITWLFILLPLLGMAQRPFKFMRENRKKASIPFELERNLLIVPLYINGKGPFNFILDTGVSILIITDPSLKDSLGLKGNREIKIRGLGEGQNLNAVIVPNMEIRIGKTIAPLMPGAVIDQDHFHLSNYMGMPIFGIIGFDFFNSFVVKVNYQTSRLKVYHPSQFNREKYNRKRSYEKIPIELEQQRPYLTAPIQMLSGRVVKSKLIIDSGAGHPLLLDPRSNPAFQLKDTTVSAVLGIGLNGPIHGYLGRLNSLSLGRFEIDYPIASFPEYDAVLYSNSDVSRNGNLGNDVLKRFHVIFDYQQGAMYLKPNHRFNEAFEHDMSGMSLISKGELFRRYFISNIVPDSPADSIGLKVNDEILSINLRPAREMSISEIDRLLRSEDQRNILLEFTREGRKQTVVMTLRRRI